MNTEEVEIQEDELVEDEIVEEVEEQEEAEQEQEDEKEDPYRSKLNATNRFLQKEGYKFENGTWIKPTATATVKPKKAADTNISPLDTLAFIDAGVTNVDDISEVVKLAKGFGLSVPDALKDSTIKHRLNVLRDERKTAEAMNTRTARSGAKQVDSRQLLENLSKGEVPSDANEAEELFWARHGGRRK